MPYFTLSIRHLPKRNEAGSRLLKIRRLRQRRKPSEISLVFTHPETRFIKKTEFLYLQNTRQAGKNMFVLPSLKFSSLLFLCAINVCAVRSPLFFWRHINSNSCQAKLLGLLVTRRPNHPIYLLTIALLF
jgi:hypothetical protein